MKKQLLLVMACATLFFNFSCKTSTAPEPENKTPQKIKVPVKITFSRKLAPGEPGFGNTADGYQTTFTTFSYDDQKRLIGRKEGTYDTFFWYDDKGVINRITASNGNVFTENTISYENGRVKNVYAKTYVSGALQTDYVYTYNYTGDKLTEVVHKWDGQLAGTYRFTYTGANPTKVTVSDVSNPIEQDLTYDNKKTPYDNLSAKYALALPINPFSANNTLSRSQKFTTLNITSSATYVYTYDADGFPVTQVLTSSSSQAPKPTETRSTIEYVEL